MVNLRIRICFHWCKRWFCSLERKNKPSVGQATTRWELPNAICTDEFSMWHLQLSIRVHNHCNQDEKNYPHSVPLCTRLGGSSDRISVPVSRRCHYIWLLISSQTALHNKQNKRAGHLCLQQYQYCSCMTNNLSSPKAITASWLSA